MCSCRYVQCLHRRHTDSVSRTMASSPTTTPMVKSRPVWAMCVIALVCLHLGSLSFTNGVAVTYDYTSGPNGPAHWDKFNKTCTEGKMQSPLLITPDIMVTNEDLDELDTDYPKHIVPGNITNNGHTVELAIAGLELKINGVKYLSTQMHFHYPSEHTILGYRFPLELHLVHVEPVTKKIAVIGWLFTEGKDSSFLGQFFDKLPKYTPGSDAHYPVGPITMLSSEGTYGRYMGSLTTPPCSENVTWTVMLWDFPTVSTKQLELLKAAVPHENARPSQPANGRKFEISS